MIGGGRGVGPKIVIYDEPKNDQLYRPAKVLVKVAVKGIENYWFNHERAHFILNKFQ